MGGRGGGALGRYAFHQNPNGLWTGFSMAMHQAGRTMIQATRDQTAAALAELRSQPQTQERRVREGELERSLAALDRLLAKKDRMTPLAGE